MNAVEISLLVFETVPEETLSGINGIGVFGVDVGEKSPIESAGFFDATAMVAVVRNLTGFMQLEAVICIIAAVLLARVWTDGNLGCARIVSTLVRVAGLKTAGAAEALLVIDPAEGRSVATVLPNGINARVRIPWVRMQESLLPFWLRVVVY